MTHCYFTLASAVFFQKAGNGMSLARSPVEWMAVFCLYYGS